jgi:hypothetical protein
METTRKEQGYESFNKYRVSSFNKYQGYSGSISEVRNRTFNGYYWTDIIPVE